MRGNLTLDRPAASSPSMIMVQGGSGTVAGVPFAEKTGVKSPGDEKLVVELEPPLIPLRS